MRLLRSLTATLCLAAPLAAQAPLTTPEQALGHTIGADYRLPNYTQLQRWWEQLAAQSPRMRLDTIGRTAEGRPQLMAVLSSPANLARLNEFRGISASLAHGRIDEATAHKLAAAGKAVIWIDGGLHADEVLGANQLLELVWQFVSQNDPETLRILDDVIILAVHANPDGMELVADWYMRQADSLKRSTSGLPRLYEKYAGHDDNRDFYRLALPESRNDSRIQYRTWYPQVIYNHHQTGPAGSVMFVPPFRDPFNYVFDPLIPTSLDWVGMAMQRRFASEGKGGIVDENSTSYSTWWNGGLRTAGYFHNMIGILTESIGSPTPQTIPLRLERQLPSGDGVFPAQWGPWHFRQSIDYSMTANRAILDLASRYREDLLFNFWRMGRNSVERGSRDNWTAEPNIIAAAAKASEGLQGPAIQAAQAAVLRDPARRDARAYILPAGQPEMGNVLDFLQALSTSGIEIQKATAAFSVNGVTYPKGSFVVRGDQAFRPHVLDMFEPQHHPTDLQYPGGPPKRPYDNAGYTLAFQMGVRFDRVLEALDAPIAPITSVEIRPDPAPFNAKAKGWLLSAGSTDAFLAVNRLLKAGARVERMPNGTFHIPASTRSATILGDLARDRALPIATAGSDAHGTAVTMLRVGLWDRYGGSMPSGWTRWIMEKYEAPFELVYAPQLDAGELRARFDVLIFVDGAIPGPPRGSGGVGNRGLDTASIPTEYRSQVGNISLATTMPQLKRFLEQGGRVVAIGSSAANLATGLGLPIENQLTTTQPDGSARPLSSDKYYIPGSVLRVTIDSTQPAALGAQRITDVFFDNSPVFRFLPNAEKQGMTRIGWFAEDTPLKSGWAIGQEYLTQGVTMASARVGAGTAYLYGPEILFRAQPQGTFRFLFNVLYGNR
ncbi:MAG: M14 metallopeptidase family protein [Gemmatimonadota bacterium]